MYCAVLYFKHWTVHPNPYEYHVEACLLCLSKKRPIPFVILVVRNPISPYPAYPRLKGRDLGVTLLFNRIPCNFLQVWYDIERTPKEFLNRLHVLEIEKCRSVVIQQNLS